MRDAVAAVLTAVAQKISTRDASLRGEIPELSGEDEALLRSIAGLSMTSRIAQWEFLRAIRYIEAEAVPGDIVECGVWRGGNLALAGAMRERLKFDRSIWAYDTFAGMTAPTEHDAKPAAALDVAAKFEAMNRGDRNDWCFAALAEVRRNFAAAAGTNPDLRTIAGPVQDTLREPANLPQEIAILRLDTDFYDSTKIELEVLYPRLSPGGVLIIDDYGEWAGARKAVDEFFGERFTWLHRVTHTVRLMIKPATAPGRELADATQIT